MLTQSTLHEIVSFRVAASSVGPGGYLTLPHLIRMLQEAAMRNTVRLGISSPELIESQGLSWVLRRQKIDARRWPKLGEDLTVVTAPSGFERQLQTFRDFHLRDERGQTIITATTEWLLMNVTSRRLQPIPPDIARLKDLLAPAAAHLKRPTGKIPAPANPTLATSSTVAYYQLDFNNHLTNPVFPELMLEPLGHDFLARHLPSQADIMFYQEARYDDAVTAQAGPEEDRLAYGHALRRGEELLATMRTSWREIAG
jgi:acyl-ACP thioesterase